MPLALYGGKLLRYAKDDDKGWRGGHHLVVSGTRGGKGADFGVAADVVVADAGVVGGGDDLVVGDDDRADDIAATVVHTVMEKIKAIPMYRNAIPTQSVLTITSNVVYGKATGAFPSGHKAGTPFSPGANPENGADSHGMVASMLSVGKLDYKDALDGISLTNTITPSGLGRTPEERINNLVGVLDAGFIMEK